MTRVLAAGAALAAVLLASGCGLTRTSTHTITVTQTVTRTVTVTAPPTTTTSAPGGACTGSGLSGTFAAQQGSAGAGTIVYTLQLVNTGSSSCSVSGVPGLQLLDKNGKDLPTKVSQAPGSSGGTVLLEPGQSTLADARFSPDVPGPGEQQTGPCEPTATKLAVTPNGGGTVTVPIAPPTAVCVSGALAVSSFRAAS